MKSLRSRRVFILGFAVVLLGYGTSFAGGFSLPSWPFVKEYKAVQPVKKECVVPQQEKKAFTLPFEKGEQLKFKVNYKGLSMGTSILTFRGPVDLNGQAVYSITFNTAMPLVKDKEILYADTKTFLPVRVERDISRAGAFPLKISEQYDQDHFKIDITKKGNIAKSRMTIQKACAINNAILLSYFYRSLPEIEKQGEYAVTLPTADFKVVYKGKEFVKTALGELHAYVFTSIPAKFKLWISADARRIPLKIENPGTLGYSLEIKSIEYVPEERSSK